ncbi:MAG: DUF5107 domain-containing protein [Fimbriimonadaceae bacterium]
MPADLFEDTVELEVGTLQAAVPVPSGPGWDPEPHRACYPYPLLRLTGRPSAMAFRSVVLENPALRVVVVPELGGRILSLYDKRTGTEILPPSRALYPVDRGPRGAWLREGIQIVVGPDHRPGAMGPTEYLLRPPVEDDAPASVVLHEIVLGCGLSWHATLSLHAERAELVLACRVFNRNLAPVRCQSGLWFELGDAEPRRWDAGVAWYDANRRCGLALIGPNGGPLDRGLASVYSRDGELRVERSGAGGSVLGPRQTDAWEVAILPVSGLPGLGAVTRHAAGFLDRNRLAIQSFEPRLGHRLFLLSADDQNFEAPADLYPEQPLLMDLSQSPEPVAVSLRDPGKADLLTVDLRSPMSAVSGEPAPSRPSVVGQALEAAAAARSADTVEGAFFVAVEAMLSGHPFDARAFSDAARVPGLAGPARVAEAMRQLRAGSPEEAASTLLDALNDGAEDHLVWWLRAVCLRLAGQDGGGDDAGSESPELPNAHYLAPLEPALRAESFLAQPKTMTKDPNPLVRPLANNPDALIEVACLLLDAGLREDASRWIDEALRHRDEPMLRYLQADSLLAATRMEIESAEMVRRAAGKPIEPPYPWRPAERAAVRRLADRFPQDTRLATLKQMVEAFR